MINGLVHASFNIYPAYSIAYTARSGVGVEAAINTLNMIHIVAWPSRGISIFSSSSRRPLFENSLRCSAGSSPPTSVPFDSLTFMLKPVPLKFLDFHTSLTPTVLMPSGCLFPIVWKLLYGGILCILYRWPHGDVQLICFVKFTRLCNHHHKSIVVSSIHLSKTPPPSGKCLIPLPHLPSAQEAIYRLSSLALSGHFANMQSFHVLSLVFGFFPKA